MYIVGCGKQGKDLSKDDLNKVLNKFISFAKSSHEINSTFIIPALRVDQENDGWVLQKLGMLAENSMYVYEAKLGKKNIFRNQLKKVTISYETKKRISTLKKNLKTV